MTAITSLTSRPTKDQRRAALLELAGWVDIEDRHPSSAPFSPVLSLIVPPLCAFTVARDVDGAVNMFNQLVGAVHELGRFTANEDDWLDAHDLPRTDRQREVTHAHLQSDVDTWANRLMGAGS
jgi:hypothetical protein